MRKHCKKIISYILLITLVFTIIGDKNPVLADENIDEGKCGLILIMCWIVMALLPYPVKAK